MQIFNLETGNEILNIGLRKTNECRPGWDPLISNLTYIDQESNLALIGNCCDQYSSSRSCVYQMINLSNAKEVSKIELFVDPQLKNINQVTYNHKAKKLSYEYDTYLKEFDFLNNSEKEFKFNGNGGEILLIDQSSQVVLSFIKNTNITEIYDFPVRKKLGELVTDFDNHYLILDSYRKIANRFLVFPFINRNGMIKKIEILDLVTGKSIIEEGIFSYIQSGEDDLVFKQYSEGKGLTLLYRLDIQSGVFKEIYKSKNLYYNDVSNGVISLQGNEEILYFTRHMSWNDPGLAGSLSLKNDELKYRELDCMPDSFSELILSANGQYYLCTNDQKTAWWKVW